MPLPRNRFGKRTTAEQALDGRSLSGLRAVVTGAAAGLGAETTRVLAKAGADVVMACRSASAGEQAAADIAAGLASGAGKVTVRPLDLADLRSVKAFAEAARDDGPVDLLVQNAGVMATPLGATAQGFELQMGTNHLGHFLLTHLLRPRLAPSARVVTVSSAIHTRGTAESVLATLESDRRYESRKYVPFTAYGDSKLANILFTRALARRLPPGQSAFSLHPGVIPTNLSRHMGFLGSIFRGVGQLFMKTVPQGAATTVFAATAPELAGHSGIYLSDCNEAAPSPAARDDALAEKVWSLSEAAVTPFA